MSEQKKKGRPQGSKTQERPVVDETPTRCIVCHSTDRTPYDNSKEIILEGDGVWTDGKPYNGVLLRHTKCTHCGQSRTDRKPLFTPRNK